VLAIAALLLIAVGAAIGRRTSPQDGSQAQPAATVTVTAPVEERGEATDVTRPKPPSPGYAQTPEGAVAAATAYVAALSGPALVDPDAVRRTVTAIASTGARDNLVQAYQSAAAHAREQLGVVRTSDESVVIRASSVGYRVDGFHRHAATVSIWRVGIVGSGAMVEPRQSWRTETVSLVWEGGTWKVDAVGSSPGPTPPLAGTPTAATELFAAIPTFEEFTRELP
jgi:hypothetical protein